MNMPPLTRRRNHRHMYVPGEQIELREHALVLVLAARDRFFCGFGKGKRAMTSHTLSGARLYQLMPEELNPKWKCDLEKLRRLGHSVTVSLVGFTF